MARRQRKPQGHPQWCICRHCLVADLLTLYESDANITRWEDSFIANIIKIDDPVLLSDKQRVAAIEILERHGLK